MDIRATKRLGKVTMYKSSKEKPCEQCKGIVTIGEIYAQFSSLRLSNSKSNPGTQYVSFSTNYSIHFDCVPAFFRENWERFQALPRKPKLKKGESYPGAGRPIALGLSPEIKKERYDLLKTLSYYRRKLSKAFEGDNWKTITLSKRKLGEYIALLYREDDYYRPNDTKHLLLGQELTMLVIQSDTRQLELTRLWQNDKEAEFGQLLMVSQESHLRRESISDIYTRLNGSVDYGPA